MSAKKYRVLIIGGGTGGIAVAARLARVLGPGQVGLIEPAEIHYYQPMWTLVGAGDAQKSDTARPMGSLIPKGVEWIKSKVASIESEVRQVKLIDGVTVGFDFLVVAPGLKLNWDKIQGLGSSLGQNGICTIYEADQAEKAREMISGFNGGTAIFVMPPVPIKCAGAPQKIMYLADQVFRQNGVRKRSKVIFATAGKAMFGIPVFAEALAKVAADRGIEPHFEHKIVGVDPTRKVALFDVPEEGGAARRVELSYDLLHLVPTMSAPDFIQNSELALAEGDLKGWLAVDKHTLQHLKFPHIFGVGDVTGVPNSKTGAAIRKQAPIVVRNILDVMAGRQPSAHYDGYSSCPLITEFGKVMLAEFGYDSKLMPTFPLNPAVSRRSMWVLKKYLLPVMYWHGMMKGRA